MGIEGWVGIWSGIKGVEVFKLTKLGLVLWITQLLPVQVKRVFSVLFYFRSRVSRVHVFPVVKAVWEGHSISPLVALDCHVVLLDELVLCWVCVRVVTLTQSFF